ncbi:MarR family winged helix-turn-helix transcriptional regulator [Sagittula stellata]|nr:MarR family transcriptional regulator [Sagittula stellata]
MTLAPQDMFCFALYSATHAMQQAYRPLLEEIGLTYPQYLVMSALWTADKPLSVSGIGRQVQLESSTLTPLLKRLETAGHIVRRRNPEDERQLQVDLTDEGRALQARAAHIPACILEKTGLDIETLRRLQGEIRDLTHHLRTGTEDA